VMQQAVQQNPPPTAVTSLSEVKCGLKATVEREVFLCVLAPGTVRFLSIRFGWRYRLSLQPRWMVTNPLQQEINKDPYLRR